MPTFAILIWPFCALIIGFQLPIDLAVIWAVLVPYLFLPESFSLNFSGLPDMGKPEIISVGLLIVLGVKWFQSRSAPENAHSKPASPVFGMLVTCCVVIIIASPILTVLNNREALRFGPTVVQGLPTREALSLVMSSALMLVPYFFARRYLATPERHVALLFALAATGLLYSFLMLVEMRLSPQLHRWTYGFYQISFGQHIRGDGWRPMMFLKHGLFVGFFIFSCVIAAFGLWKARRGAGWLLAAGWLLVILIMSKNLGATAIAFVMVAIFLGTPRRIQILAAMGIAIVVLFYPILRQANFIPLEQITTMAANISEDRARSLQFRLRNEDQILERAFEKPVTGWGRFGRSMIYNERGNPVSVSEGVWIQTISQMGWVGYVGLFGALTLPILFLGMTSRRRDIPVETVSLVMITAGNLIYMIPTTTLTPVGWLVFGALTGFVQSGAKEPTAMEDEEPGEKPVSRYSRFGPRHRPQHYTRTKTTT